MTDFDVAVARRLIEAAHPADARMACADCCPAARTRRDMAALLPAALDEIERLTGCLTKANDNHETFERLWYLTQDENERLRRLLTEACDYIEADTDPDEEHPMSARLRKQALSLTTQRQDSVGGFIGADAVTREPLHQARLTPWSTAELMAQLCVIVDTLAADKDRAVSPLDVALELLGGELEAFVLFGRMGHLDPPRADGKVAIGILRRVSDDPEIDARIRETAKKWTAEQESRS